MVGSLAQVQGRVLDPLQALLMGGLSAPVAGACFVRSLPLSLSLPICMYVYIYIYIYTYIYIYIYIYIWYPPPGIHTFHCPAQVRDSVRLPKIPKFPKYL